MLKDENFYVVNFFLTLYTELTYLSYITQSMNISIFEMTKLLS